jgi:hypothetical protein
MTFAPRSKKREGVPPGSTAALPKRDFSRLRIAAPNDAHEVEAHRVAGAMTRGASTVPQWSLSGMSKAAIRTGADNTPGSAAPDIVQEVARSPGQPLDPATRAYFEPRFGQDFGHVRLHTDARSAESARAVDALAYAAGDSIVIDTGRVPGGAGNRRLLAHELVHTVQQQRGLASVLQRQPHAAPELKLVEDFAVKFPAAAKLIKTNPAAMKLVKEAFDAGAKFGGFAEDGPDKASGRAYTVGDTVYVPKGRGAVPVEAMSDFLFELNNAIRGPRFAALATAAAGGAKTDLAAARKYAHDVIEGEVEGMLRLGEVWFETKKKYLGKKSHEFDKYDEQFFLAEYKSFHDHKKTKEDIVNDILTRKYETGDLEGKTTEQTYMEQYQGLAH